MAKRPVKKKPAKDHQQIARSVLDAIVPDAEPRRKTTMQDKLDVARAVDEGMGQPQDLDPPALAKKNPAAVALGSLGGKKGGPARAKKLSPARRKAIAKKAASARWGNKGKK